MSSIIEVGTVTKASSAKATVRIAKRPECEGCKACGMVKDYLDITLVNSLNAVVGDRVRLSIVPVKDRMFAVIVYLMPLLFVVLAMGVAKWLGGNDVVMSVAALAALAVGFVVAFATDRRRSAKYNLNPTMLEKISVNVTQNNVLGNTIIKGD